MHCRKTFDLERRGECCKSEFSVLIQNFRRNPQEQFLDPLRVVTTEQIMSTSWLDVFANEFRDLLRRGTRKENLSNALLL